MNLLRRYREWRSARRRAAHYARLRELLMAETAARAAQFTAPAPTTGDPSKGRKPA